MKKVSKIDSLSRDIHKYIMKSFKQVIIRKCLTAQLIEWRRQRNVHRDLVLVYWGQGGHGLKVITILQHTIIRTSKATCNIFKTHCHTLASLAANIFSSTSAISIVHFQYTQGLNDLNCINWQKNNGKEKSQPRGKIMCYVVCDYKQYSSNSSCH